MVKKLVLILIMEILLSLNYFNVEYFAAQEIISRDKVLSPTEKNYIFISQLMIEKTKEFEGLVLTPYLCPALQKTIGYGHALKKKDKRFIKGITEEQADSILLTDIRSCITYTHNLTGLEGEKLLAISHFVFCYGSIRPSVLRALKNGKHPKHALRQYVIIKKFIGYDANGKKLYSITPSKHLEKMRQFEIDLWDGKYNLDNIEFSGYFAMYENIIEKINLKA